MRTAGRALVVLALASLKCTGSDAKVVELKRVSSSPPASMTATPDPVALAHTLGVPPESLRAAGEERYARQAYDSARVIWLAEITRARRTDDHIAEARARMWVGLAAWRLGEYDVARREGEAALAAKRRLGLDAELSRSFNALGLLAWNEGRHLDALRLFDSAVVSARRHGDATGVARAAANLPLVRVEIGDFDGARLGLETALAAGRATDDDRLQGNALANLAMLEIRLGQPMRAIPLLARARARYAAIDYGTGEANALGQLATAWSELGDLQRALASADSAVGIARAHGLQQEVAAELEVIADLHEQAGNPRLALRSLAEADSMDAALGLRVERATNLRRTATILLELGEVDASVQRARQALAGHQATDASTETVYDALQLARSLSRSGDTAEARITAETATRNAIRFRNPSAVRDAAAVAARLALDAGDPRSALVHLTTVSSEHDLPAGWQLADLRCEAVFALRRLDEARREGERAVALLERERASLGGDPLRAAYLANRVAPFSRLIAVHLARGDTSSAFRVASMVPGRALSERLGSVGESSSNAASLVAGERLLLRAGALERQIAELSGASHSEEQRIALARALDRTRGEYTEQAARHAPAPDARVLDAAAVDPAVVQSRLGEREALLTFVSGPDRLDIFLVRRTVILHRSVPVGERALAQRIRVARALLGADHRPAEALVALGDLHDKLVGPWLGAGMLDEVERLGIVPHGPLSALPFAALWNRTTHRHLVETLVVRYLPSVGAVTIPREYSAFDARRVDLFAPFPDSLASTAPEVRAVARLFASSRVRIGLAADEPQVRAALREGHSVHIASHGRHSGANPLYSSMLVGRQEREDASSDGRLEVHEILALRTASPLVFLSGCETGLGGSDAAFAPAAETASLAQAFLAAGAGTVVATLWPVEDADAMRMAIAFYTALRRGARADEALALAQRDAIRQPERRTATWMAYTVSSLSGANGGAVSVQRK
jgi:CHAT domain-containing protein